MTNTTWSPVRNFLTIAQSVIDRAPMVRIIPWPGVYEVDRTSWCQATYVRVIGRAACGGPFFDAEFDVCRNGYTKRGAKPKRMTIRMAVDGSWRDASTLLPVNMNGQTFA
jgi:hypothetical protein